MMVGWYKITNWSAIIPGILTDRLLVDYRRGQFILVEHPGGNVNDATCQRLGCTLRCEGSGEWIRMDGLEVSKGVFSYYPLARGSDQSRQQIQDDERLVLVILVRLSNYVSLRWDFFCHFM